jgi:hypothetical protein
LKGAANSDYSQLANARQHIPEQITFYFSIAGFIPYFYPLRLLSMVMGLAALEMSFAFMRQTWYPYFTIHIYAFWEKVN